MKVLFIYQYFRPEVGAGVERVFYTVKYLKSLGHDVTVLTGIPNYPTGKIYPGYSLNFFQKEEVDGLRLIRTFVFPTKYTSAGRRLFNYFSFTVSAFLAGLFQRTDVIIASSPPLSSGVVGLFLSILKGKPLIFEPQDVWPGAAIEIGALKNKFVIGLSRYFEKAIYKRASVIVAPTEETKQILLKDNPFLADKKVKVSANSVDLENFDAQRLQPSLTDKYKKPDNFLVVYTGTLGLQQGMTTLIEAAKILRDKKKILFLLVGEGVDKELIGKDKKKFGLDNLIFSPAVSYGEIPSILSKADAGLALLKKNRYQDAALAVKTFDYMAAGKPVIVSGGEAMRKMIEENKVGFWSLPEDPQALVETISQMANLSKEELIRRGKNGRNLVEKFFNKKKQVEVWGEILKTLKEEQL